MTFRSPKWMSRFTLKGSQKNHPKRSLGSNPVYIFCVFCAFTMTDSIFSQRCSVAHKTIPGLHQDQDQKLDKSNSTMASLRGSFQHPYTSNCRVSMSFRCCYIHIYIYLYKAIEFHLSCWYMIFRPNYQRFHRYHYVIYLPTHDPIRCPAAPLYVWSNRQLFPAARVDIPPSPCSLTLLR